jgi:hypothetical protein
METRQRYTSHIITHILFSRMPYTSVVCLRSLTRGDQKSFPAEGIKKKSRPWRRLQEFCEGTLSKSWLDLVRRDKR